MPPPERKNPDVSGKIDTRAVPGGLNSYKLTIRPIFDTLFYIDPSPGRRRTRRRALTIQEEFTMYKVDLNSDLGESFGAYTIGMDEAVLAHVSSSSISRYPYRTLVSLSRNME